MCGEWGCYESFLIIIEAGHYYSKPTFIMTLIKQEKLVHIGYLYLGVLMCFYKIVHWVPGYLKMSNFGYPVPEITENVHP